MARTLEFDRSAAVNRALAMRTLATLHPRGFHVRGRARSFVEGRPIKIVSVLALHELGEAMRQKLDPRLAATVWRTST